MSETPRTDSQAFEQQWNGRKPTPQGGCTDADFSRTLERELAQAHADIAELNARLSERVADYMAAAAKRREEYNEVKATLVRARQMIEWASPKVIARMIDEVLEETK